MFIGMVEVMPNVRTRLSTRSSGLQRRGFLTGSASSSTARQKPFPRRPRRRRFALKTIDLAAEKARKQRQFRVERNKSCGKHKEQTPLTEREAMVLDDLSTHRSQGGGPQRILPITLLVQMGMLLFTQSQCWSAGQGAGHIAVLQC